MRKKELVYEICKACKIPEDVATKVLNIILDVMTQHLKRHKRLYIRDFGKWKLFKKKRMCFVPGQEIIPHTWEVGFKTKGSLSYIIKQHQVFRSYAWTLVKKYNRLKKEYKKLKTKEEKIKNKETRKKTIQYLKKYLRKNIPTAKWLADRGYLPFPLTDILPSDE